MAKDWKELKAELDEETRRILLICPDEIKRFHYGIMTHSDAGKRSYDQYFGHWVHAYCEYLRYVSDLSVIVRYAMDPTFAGEHIRKLVADLVVASAIPFGEYGGQKLQAKYAAQLLEALDTAETAEQRVELLQAYYALISRIYWWFHWYFPWGIGPSTCHRRTPADVREMARLAGIT